MFYIRHLDRTHTFSTRVKGTVQPKWEFYFTIHYYANEALIFINNTVYAILVRLVPYSRLLQLKKEQHTEFSGKKKNSVFFFLRFLLENQFQKPLPIKVMNALSDHFPRTVPLNAQAENGALKERNCSEQNWECDRAVRKAPAVRFQPHELRRDISLHDPETSTRAPGEISHLLSTPTRSLSLFSERDVSTTRLTTGRWWGKKEQRQWNDKWKVADRGREWAVGVGATAWRQETQQFWKTKKTRCHF